MTINEVVPRVEKVFSGVFGRQLAFSPSLSRTAEPRWTSLKHVEFIIALEMEFDLRFDGSDATDMTSIDVVVDTIARRLS
jgi:acyl carrier protein